MKTFIKLEKKNISTYFGVLKCIFNFKSLAYFSLMAGKPVNQGGMGLVTLEGDAIKILVTGGFGIPDEGRRFLIGDTFLLETEGRDARVTIGCGTDGFEIFILI